MIVRKRTDRTWLLCVCEAGRQLVHIAIYQKEYVHKYLLVAKAVAETYCKGEINEYELHETSNSEVLQNNLYASAGASKTRPC